MKKLYFFLSLTAVLFLGTACSSDNKMGIEEIEATSTPKLTKSFAEADGSTDLSKRSAGYKAYKLLTTAGPKVGEPLGSINITDEQYAEIKAFTDELVAGCTTDEEIHSTVHSWLVANIGYSYGYNNDPYPAFINRKCICQGYANLMKVMLHSQGVPCVLTNGYIPAGGHAWCYVFFNNKWYASDPTNNYFYAAATYSSNSSYTPTSLDAVLFEDDYCTYGYYEEALNVSSIKEGHEVVSIPYSAGGFIVSMLNPTLQVPESVKELYVGTNISSLGNNVVGLKNFSKSIEQIYIDPESAYFESFSAGVYDKEGNLKLIAPGAKHLELKPIAIFDKECMIKDLPYLETVTFVPGTNRIDAWAIERCPSLQIAFIPQETAVNSSAFSGVASNFIIIRGNFTNIPQIKY